MTDAELQDYYNKLVNYKDSQDLRSLPNNDRRHNATILCFILKTSKEVNMYCGEMSIFRENFYSHIEKDNPGVGKSLKRDMIAALEEFVERTDVKLNIIVENYYEAIFSDFISYKVFRDGIISGKITIRKLNKIAASQNLSHCVYTDTRVVRIEENREEHSGMFLANMSETLMEKFRSNFNYLYLASEPVRAAI